jgi:anti-sigma regulatory factor (Ser/Thr protein kinase)
MAGCRLGAVGERKVACCPGMRPVAEAWGFALSDQAAAPGGGFRHVAWLYRTANQYLAGVGEFAAAGARAGEPVLIAVPAGRLPPGWGLLDGMAGARSLDVDELGRNPSRLVPVVRAFAGEHAGQRVRVVAELAWPGRSASELGEIARYEMLLNLAFADSTLSMLCPYDVAGLPGSVTSAVRASHPWLWQAGQDVRSGDYDAAAALRARRGSLPVPPGALSLSYRYDLRPVRAFVAAEAARAGLSGTRRTDLVIAASEVAANTLKHTDSGGIVRIWVTSDEVLCQFDDSGYVADPLAGYGRPSGDVLGGQGLWLVNQVCDLAEIRTSAVGTKIRLHMFRDGPQAVPAGREQARQPRLDAAGR